MPIRINFNRNNPFHFLLVTGLSIAGASWSAIVICFFAVISVPAAVWTTLKEVYGVNAK